MNKEQKYNIQTICIFNELKDIQLALKHNDNARQYFLQFSDDELKQAIKDYYKDEYVKIRQETKNDNYNGEYTVNLTLKSYQYVNNDIERFNSIVIKALNEYGLEVEEIKSEKK